MKLLLSKPRGFCAGVERAIETVERALSLWGAPYMSNMKLFIIDMLWMD